jgi:hypothetical protein
MRLKTPRIRARKARAERGIVIGYSAQRAAKAMWIAILTVFLTFLLTGVAGNRLVHYWQHRNWLRQQLVLNEEKEHEALQHVFDEISELAGKRQHRMFRLLHGIRGTDDEALQQRQTDYDEATIAWNDRLISLFARVTMHAEWRLTKRLEDDIQAAFVTIGANLDKMARDRLAGRAMNSGDTARVLAALNKLQGKISGFEKDVIRFMQSKRKSFTRAAELTPYNLDRFPTWELLKALFERRIQGNKII